MNATWTGFKAALIFSALVLTSCSTPTIVLEPTQEASLYGEKRTDNFGVCVGLDRRGTRLFMWDEFLRQNRRGSDPTDFHMAGYEMAVTRGESCHLRIMDTFQTAVQFDLSSLPSTAIVSAELRIDDIRHNGTDPPRLLGSREQCEVMMVGAATEAWTPGRFGPDPMGTDTSRPFLTWRPTLRDAGPHFTFRESLDVTKEVSDWARGVRPNNGFVITPDPDFTNRTYEETDEGGFICSLWIVDYRLRVVVAARE